MDVKTLSIDTIGLTNRSKNALHQAQVHTIGDMLGYTEEMLTEIRNLGKKSVDEILAKIEEYRKLDESRELSNPTEESVEVPEDFSAWIKKDDGKEYVLSWLREVKIDALDLLSPRAYNLLMLNGYDNLGQIAFLTETDLMEIPRMEAASAGEIVRLCGHYLRNNSAVILAAYAETLAAAPKSPDVTIMDDTAIRNLILKQYQMIGFDGLSLNEMTQRLQLPESVTQERLKRIIGSLLAENELEYVDFRCYRVYGRFADFLDACDAIEDRSKDFIRKRLEGITLEDIATDYSLTKERVRQIVKKDVQKVRNWYEMKTGKAWFDEDYFRYFYETYAFEKKDGIEWFGMTAATCNYLDLMDVKRGKKDLQSALEDHRSLDAGLRLKVKNHLNRNKIFVDGMWVEKRRADLEEVVVRKFCPENVSFDHFVQIYNDFLKQEDVAYDEDIYYTEAVYRTRKSHLSAARYLLWKQNEQIRYYDIEGRDFTELLDTLNLEAYENIELSTLKFVEDYPEILEKFDIRDQYELHNLLRKIVPEGSYHEFHCGKMPEIKFGSFDRDAAILDILIDNAPIRIDDLCDLIHAEYGYDSAVIKGTYLKPFTEYYHQGMYTIDQKAMTAEHKEKLKATLPEDFYYIDEVRRTYRRLFPDADLDEVNPYNLKLMGFVVLSRYVVQNHSSLEAFCEDILTREDIIDLTPYRKRFVYMQMFSQKLMELKRNLQIIEFEPNQIIHFRKLERSGVTKEMVLDFCDAVYDFVEDGAYFSVQSIKQDGFESKLFDLGFSDWFYANLLISDDRFSFGAMFGNIILYKGHENITIKSFEMNRIKEYGSIDAYDLMTELTDRFGCRISNHGDVVYKIQGTEIYYDKILDRFYASADTYYQELDATEGI